MKSIKKYIFAGLAATCVAVPAAAQHNYSGYFLDGYTYRYQLNPAFANDQNFVAMPVLGNLNLGMRGTLHLTDVLYNVDGKTALFTNPKVDTGEAMKKFGNKNRLAANEKIELLAAGFKAFGGYNTVSVSANMNLEASIPKAFFALAKEGISNQTYDIKNMFGYADAYAQIAFNHSRDIKQVPGLRVGAALKFRIGIGAVDFRFNEADLTLGTDSWTARTNADVYASVGGLKFKQKTYTPKGPDSHMAPYDYVSGADMDNFGIQGFGMGFDLGATYKWNDFNFSVAILDLGFMAWGKTQWASTDGTQTINTDAYTFNANSDADNSFSNEMDLIRDDLSKLYQLKDMGEKSSFTRGMATTLNFGVDYIFPYYRNLHFGLLNSTRIYGPYTSTQFRLSANVAPVSIFSADINLGLGTFGADFGWMLNLHLQKGFNLFLGMDHTMGKLAKQGIPLNSNATFNFGMNFPF